MDAHDHEPWCELRTLAARIGPRYDAETCGRCPVCGLGPTAMMFLTFIPWALCGFCDVRWPVTTDLFDVPEDDDDTYHYFFNLLAEADDAAEIAQRIQIPEGDSDMKKQTATTIDPTPITHEAVEQLVQAAEALTSDAPGLPDGVARAHRAAEALRVEAMGHVFPGVLAPVEPGVLEDFRLAIESAGVLPFESIVPVLVRLHAETIDHHPQLAEVVRGLRGLRLIRRHAQQSAAGDPDAGATAEARALSAFVGAVSRQLVERGVMLPAAAVLSTHVPEWTARLDAVAHRRAEHEAAERRAAEEAEARERAERDAVAREAVRQERAARLRSEDRAQRDRREDLAKYFRGYGRWRFTVGGEKLTGEQCAAALEEGAVFQLFYSAQLNGEPVRR